MAKVLMPIAQGFEEVEALTVVDLLRRAGIEVVMAGLQPGPITGAHSISVIPETTIDTVKTASFDMLVIPGGQPGTDNLNADSRVHTLLNDFAAKDKLIAAICAAPSILASVGLLNGKRATCYPSYRDRLNGAIYEDKPVVCDGSIITSQGVGTAISFGLELAVRLAGRHTSDAVAKAILFQSTSTSPVIWSPRLFNSTIQALVGALEMKDTYTQGHARRVTEFSLSIGAKLNLPPEELRDLYLGAILHDIGKIGTEEEVLNKPESLNRREASLVREHPIKGTLFIVGIEELSHIVPVILHHHEHWDGSGYPGRLKGDQIPLHARIVAVADAYDAMISNRSYRDGLDKDAALLELVKKKGTQFEPFLVDVFIECLNDSPFEMKDFSFYF
ncbi:MAG TPA: HD domain-containing protein [Desulfuromonadales bacterium]|nr:HD domain-containing protein [Desulfuromonadales bacterium]